MTWVMFPAWSRTGIFLRGFPTECASSAMVQALGMQAQHHGAMANAIAELAHSVGKPRKKIPVRDQAGNITHVIESGE